MSRILYGIIYDVMYSTMEGLGFQLTRLTAGPSFLIGLYMMRFPLLLGVVVAVAIVSGCAFPRPPDVAPFADAKYWVLTRPLPYNIPETDLTIEVPAGFVTDFASVPQCLCALLPSSGRYLAAAILHDYLYWNQSCTKKQADDIFLLAMKESYVELWRRVLLYGGVHLFGTDAYESNAKEARQGGTRYVPPEKLPLPFDQTWETCRPTLVGIPDITRKANHRYVCDEADKATVRK